MEIKNKVDRYFQGEERYNCAQAVLKIMEERYPDAVKRIPEFQAFGGGRAPEGLCGALFSALELADESVHAELRKRFKESAGAENCREVRSMKKLSCRDCVEKASRILHEA